MANSEFEHVQYVSPKRPRRKFHKKWLLLLLIPALLAAAYLGAGELGYYYYIQRYGATAPKDAEIFCDPIVTAPGQLEIYAYDLNQNTIVEYENCTKLEPGIELSEEYGLFWGTGTHRALPLTFSLVDEELADAAIAFSFSLSRGEYTRRLGDTWYTMKGRAYLGQSFRLENNQIIDWNVDLSDIANHQPAYTDIVIYADGHIVGCATLQIYTVDKEVPSSIGTLVQTRYFPKLLGSVSFPKQEGCYQQVKTDDVQGYFAQWKQESEHSAQ